MHLHKICGAPYAQSTITQHVRCLRMRLDLYEETAPRGYRGGCATKGLPVSTGSAALSCGRICWSLRSPSPPPFMAWPPRLACSAACSCTGGHLLKGIGLMNIHVAPTPVYRDCKQQRRVHRGHWRRAGVVRLVGANGDLRVPRAVQGALVVVRAAHQNILIIHDHHLQGPEAAACIVPPAARPTQSTLPHASGCKPYDGGATGTITMQAPQ